jgi:hypothetical protein
MAVRFPCASCRQPIEIDDAWAGSSVACPYCRKVITAPRESTWPPREIPVAAPIQPGFSPPPPPPGYQGPAFGPGTYATTMPGRAGTNSATSGLLLAVASALLWGVGFLIWMSTILAIVVTKTGPNPTQDELRKALPDVLASAPPSPAAATVLLVGTFCGIAGLVLGIRSLVRGEQHTGKAIATCVLGSLAVFCNVIIMVAMVGSRTTAH